MGLTHHLAPLRADPVRTGATEGEAWQDRGPSWPLPGRPIAACFLMEVKSRVDFAPYAICCELTIATIVADGFSYFALELSGGVGAGFGRYHFHSQLIDVVVRSQSSQEVLVTGVCI